MTLIWQSGDVPFGTERARPQSGYRRFVCAVLAFLLVPPAFNTSFNVRGEPIVCTPEDAFRCFMGNELDMLVIGNCILRKEQQDPALKRDYSSAFTLD
ncbi:carbamoyltransferase C-terminal domain-containing protein [Bradyrhizobium sp. U531]